MSWALSTGTPPEPFNWPAGKAGSTPLHLAAGTGKGWLLEQILGRFTGRIYSLQPVRYLKHASRPCQGPGKSL